MSGFDRPSGCEVSHTIDIAAPPELVWDFVADFEGWGAWNPLYRQTSGRTVEGGTLAFTVVLQGLKPQRAKAQVYRVEPGERLDYGLRSFAGLLRICRYVDVIEISPTQCRVVNGEIMSGPLGRVLNRLLGARVGDGLAEMSRALKLVAERKWNARPA